jgi:deoxyribonuclease V
MKNEWLFPKNIREAQAAQVEMAQKVLREDLFFQPITHIAGVDISNTPFDPAQMIFASMVVLSYPSLEIVEIATSFAKQEFPYIPGLLGFREVPILIETYRKLSIHPDLIMVDGHGVSHPRGLGIASHLGVLLDIPTIGVAKSVLVGKPVAPLSEEAGTTVLLQWKGQDLGVLFRSKKRSSPLIISTGHKISLKGAVNWVSQCLRGYKLPEPTRQAHLAANICRKNYQSHRAIS